MTSVFSPAERRRAAEQDREGGQSESHENLLARRKKRYLLPIFQTGRRRGNPREAAPTNREPIPLDRRRQTFPARQRNRALPPAGCRRTIGRVNQGPRRKAMKRCFFLTLASAVALAVGPGLRDHARVVFTRVPASRATPARTPGEAPCDRCRPSLFGPRVAPVLPPRRSPPSRPAHRRRTSPAPSRPAATRRRRSSTHPAGRCSTPASAWPAPIPDLPDSGRDALLPYGAPMPQPPVVDEKDAASPLPVDIPQFAIVKDRIASGLQPFPDGITWLQAHQYRTVLHVRAPGEDDAAARRQFEKHGLRYLSLEASPNTLSRAVVRGVRPHRHGRERPAAVRLRHGRRRRGRRCGICTSARPRARRTRRPSRRRRASASGPTRAANSGRCGSPFKTIFAS